MWKEYVFVLVVGYSRFTWVNFLREKSEACSIFESLVKLFLSEKSSRNLTIARLRTDHGTKFEISIFDALCGALGIKHVYSAPYIPQQNEIVERK